MSEIEINKALYGVIQPDGKWHELYDYTYSGAKCICDNKFHYINKRHATGNPDYFSKEGFVDLLEWLRNSECWLDFISDNCHDIMEILDYKTFAGYVHDFLKEHGIISQPESPAS